MTGVVTAGDDCELWRRGQKIIYALCDPDGTPRYVGQSYFKQRLEQHIYTAQLLVRRRQAASPRDRQWSQKEVWIIDLLQRGERPLLKGLEIVSRDKAGRFERLWINWYLKEGYPLTNGRRSML